MQNPEISVIVPVYKVEQYLPRCIQSILRQTYKNIEAILVDDGSPDGCGAICDEYAKEDSRVQVLHKPNGGLSSARNAGIEQARGHYIAFVDSDDWIDADMLEILYNAVKKYDAQIAECSFRSIYPNCIREETACTAACIEGTNLDALEGILDWNHFKSVAWNKLYARETIGDIRYPLGKLHEDEYTTYKFFYNAEKLVYVDVSKYNYNCTRTDSIMTDNFREDNLDGCFAMRERIRFFREHGITSLEEKADNVYCWVLLEKLYAAYSAKVKGPKLDQALAMVAEDAVYFRQHPLDLDYLEKLEFIAAKGLSAYGKMRDKQEAM